MNDMMDQAQSAQSALAQARELSSAGRHREAVYYYTNALTHAPGDVDIVQAYASAVLDAIEVSVSAEEGGYEASQQLEWLEAFLVDQTAHVPSEHIPSLVERISEVQQRRAELAKAIPADVDPEVDELARKLRKLADGKMKFTVPKMLESLREQTEALTELRQYATADGGLSDQDKEVVKLDEHLQTLATTTRYELLRQEIEALLGLARKEKSTDGAAYCLQLCESNVRELVVLAHRVDKTRRGAAATLVADLRKVSDEMSERSHKETSEAAWKEIEGAIEGDLKKATAWKPPKRGVASKACQLQLERLDVINRRLGAGYGGLPHPQFSKKAEKLMEKIQSLAAKASLEQQKAYNAWAMKQIREGFEKGEDETGILGDEEELGVLMVKHLGPVDSRFLTSDVQRCYTEVFEYLFQELKGPKNKEDFKTKGRKLKVLSDLFDKAKKDIKDF